jgi:hypothetical protein
MELIFPDKEIKIIFQATWNPVSCIFVIKELKFILGIFTFNEMLSKISHRLFAEILRLD